MKVLVLVAIFAVSGALSESDVTVSHSSGEGSNYEYAYNIHDPTTGSVQSVQQRAVAIPEAVPAVPEVVIRSVAVPEEGVEIRQPKQAVLILGEIFNAFNKPHQKLVEVPYPYAYKALPLPEPFPQIPAYPSLYPSLTLPYPYSSYPYVLSAPTWNAESGYANLAYLKIAQVY